MLTSFTLRNFRCFRDFTITPLQRVNIITGKNNVGKTALLEGMFLFAGATNPSLAIKINSFRGLEYTHISSGTQIESPWDSLFTDFNEGKKISLIGEDSTIGKRTLNIQIVQEVSRWITEHKLDKERSLLTELIGKPLEFEYIDESHKPLKTTISIFPSGIRYDSPTIRVPYPGVFLSARKQSNPQEDAERYSDIEMAKHQDVVLKILNIIEPKLSQLKILVKAGVSMIYGEIGLNRPVPLPLTGEGMSRVCSLILAIAYSRNGIVFIDEIENGLHHSILEKIWLGVAEAARQFNTQIFATTHSRECITAAHNALGKSESYDFLMHRLDKSDGKIEAKTYDKETLEAAIETELRMR